jgi:hypothetical protein
MPPTTPSAPPPEQPKPNQPKRQLPASNAWYRLRERANTIASIAALFVFLLIVGGVGGYFYSQSKKTTPTAKPPAIQNLSPDDLKKLSEIGANLGTANQTLNIGANSLFRGKVDVGGDLSIGGRLNANGPVTLSQLNITGTTAATGLSVGSNLTVSGTTTLQKAVTIGGLLTVNSGLNITGAASVGSLNAQSIAVTNISISGPLTIGHLITRGTTPIMVAGSVGGGGTVSISGNDTAGTININTGSGPGAVLGTITFRANYGNTVHVLLTPLTSGAAGAGAFVTRNAAGFQIHANNPPAGQTLSFDYFVTQ